MFLFPELFYTAKFNTSPHSSTFHSGRYLSCKLEMYRISLQTSQMLSESWLRNDVVLIPSRLLLMYSGTYKHVHACNSWPRCREAAGRSLMYSARRTEPRGLRNRHAGEEESDFPTTTFSWQSCDWNHVTVWGNVPQAANLLHMAIWLMVSNVFIKKKSPRILQRPTARSPRQYKSVPWI